MLHSVPHFRPLRIVEALCGPDQVTGDAPYPLEADADADERLRFAMFNTQGPTPG